MKNNRSLSNGVVNCGVSWVNFEEVLGSILALITLFCKGSNTFKWFVWFVWRKYKSWQRLARHPSLAGLA